MSSNSNGSNSNGSALVNKPTKFKHGKSTYLVRRVDDEVKAEYEEWMVAQAQLSVARLRAHLPRADWEAAWNATVDHTASAYQFGGAACVASLNTQKGFIALASIMFQVDEEDMKAIYADRREEVDELVLRLYKESFPNSQAPPQTSTTKEEQQQTQGQEQPQEQTPSLADIVARATATAAEAE